MIDATEAARATKAADKPDPTPAVKLDTSNDYGLVARELTSSAEELKKLAEKNSNAGYAREAKAIRQDADHLLHRVVPRFKPQQSLPLGDEGTDVATLIERQLLEDIRKACQQAASQAKAQEKSKQPPTDGNDMESIVARAAKRIALRVSAFAHECAEAGVSAGIAVREIEDEHVVRRALVKLEPEKAE